MSYGRSTVVLRAYPMRSPHLELGKSSIYPQGYSSDVLHDGQVALLVDPQRPPVGLGLTPARTMPLFRKAGSRSQKEQAMITEASSY